MSDNVIDIDIHHGFSGFDLNVRVKAPLSGVTAVFGPSGCGKTTLLRIIAGFLKPSAGRLTFSGDVWCDRQRKQWTAAHKRPVGFMFQDTRLFPHLSVDGNLDYADKRSGAAEKGYSRADIIAAADIGGFLNRRPATLSGGERQRVALARMLLTRPQLMLFDEPLTGLDRARKTELLPFLETLPAAFNIPAIYVSHDVDEVSRIADRVAVMESGAITNVGETDAILASIGLEAGRNPYETGSLLIGTVQEHQPEISLTRLRVGENMISLPINPALSPGDKVRLKAPARDIAISLTPPEGLSIQNALAGTIAAIAPHRDAAFANVQIDVDGQMVTARITRNAVENLALESGKSVYALIKSASFQR